MTAKIIYTGQLRTENIHIKSGAKIITDAPVDNHGKGEAFSPTDLIAIGTANCMLTVCGILAEKEQFSIDKSFAEVCKKMTAHPRRIGELEIDIHFPKKLTENQRKACEEKSMNCPVVLSLHPDMKKKVHFFYDI